MKFLDMASTSTYELDDISCPICLDIFIQPISLVCKHELCKLCYEDYFLKADFRCPLCKKRLSSWARKNPSTESLINKKKWVAIQNMYPDLVKKRLNGEDTYFELQKPKQVLVAEQGRIKEEYTIMMSQWEEDNKVRAAAEEEESMKLIEEIVAQEKQELERLRLEQIENDEKFANLIANQLDSPQKSVTPPKKILRSANKQRLCKSKEKVKPVKCKMINTYFQSTSTTQPPSYRLRGGAKRRISCDPSTTQSSFEVEEKIGNDTAHTSKSPDLVNTTEQHENAATKLNFPTKQNEDLSNYRMPLRKRRRLKSV